MKSQQCLLIERVAQRITDLALELNGSYIHDATHKSNEMELKTLSQRLEVLCDPTYELPTLADLNSAWLATFHSYNKLAYEKLSPDHRGAARAWRFMLDCLAEW